jgi:hypothetical protein
MNTLIKPIDIVDNPTDPYRIVPILEEIRIIWSEEPKRTLGQVLTRVIDKEFELDYMAEITDDELLAALQNYGEMGSVS